MNRGMNLSSVGRLGTVALITALIATAAMADLSESRTISKSFDLASGGRLAIDNLFGSIKVTGSADNAVQMTVVETIEADNQAALERGREEVELLIDSQESLLDLFVDGPFRDRDDRRSWSSENRRRRYQVHYDFELSVPAGVSVDLRTVTEVWGTAAIARSAILDLIHEALVANPDLGPLAAYVADSGPARWTTSDAIDQMVQRGFDRDQLL